MNRSKLVGPATLSMLVFGSVAGCEDFGIGIISGGSRTEFTASGGNPGSGEGSSGEVGNGTGGDSLPNGTGGQPSDGGASDADAALDQAGAGGVAAGGSGPAGMAGSSGEAGEAGRTGSGGQAGSAGASGGNAGSGAASGGSSGDAGTSGASGNGGTSGTSGTPGKTCGEACDSQDDCTVSMIDQGYECNLATQRCERLAHPCYADVECIPEASAWLLDCSSDASCFFFPGDVCVSVAGRGKCAHPAVVSDAGSSCSFPTPDAVELPRFAAAGTVLVCADASRRCHAGACTASCTADAQCTPERNGSVCDLETGSCRCVADQDCRGPGVSRCNTASGRCECASSVDCEALPNTDACVEGRCGCSSVAACNGERLFSGTRWVCE